MNEPEASIWVLRHDKTTVKIERNQDGTFLAYDPNAVLDWRRTDTYEEACAAAQDMLQVLQDHTRLLAAAQELRDEWNDTSRALAHSTAR